MSHRSLRARWRHGTISVPGEPLKASARPSCRQNEPCAPVDMECVCPERRPHGDAASEDINSDDGDGCVDRGRSARLLPITQSWRTFIMLATRPPSADACVAKEGGEGRRRGGRGRKGRRGGEGGCGGRGEKGVGGVSAASDGGGAAEANSLLAEPRSPLWRGELDGLDESAGGRVPVEEIMSLCRREIRDCD